MKYESTILKRLIDTYGVVGNPRYISEIIKEFIVRGKECFPDLFTYQSDWLAHIDEFGLNPTYTVSYTGQSFYAPNTLERPVKSAILKGQTLVNLAEIVGYKTTVPKWYQIVLENKLKPNTKYFIKLDGKPSNARFVVTQTTSFSSDGTLISEYTYDNITTFNTNDTVSDYDYLKIHINDGGATEVVTTEELQKVTIVIIEYQDGMEKWDIPYFEGMQSVKMPVLTTTGKNLFKGFTKYDYSVDNGVTIKEITDNSLTYIAYSWNTSIVFYIPIDGAKNYIMSADMTNVVADDFYFVDELKQIIGTKFSLNKCVTSPTNAKFIKWHVRNANTNVDCLISNFQLEESTSLTSYEPYKTNILTVNEEVELGSVGEVKDELNLLTGQLTQRTETRAYQEGDESNSEVLTDMTNTRYKLPKEAIKTVDLSILDQNGQNVKQLMSFNGGTHFNTTSSEGSLLPVVSVSVETDLEETLNLCSTDGNTL